MSLDFKPDLDFQLDFQPDGEPSAPQSRWQAIKKQAKTDLDKGSEKHPDYPEYKRYVEMAKKAHAAGGFSKLGDIPGTEHPIPEIADFNTWRKGRGDPLAWLGSAAGTAVDVGLATAGGLWDVTGGLAKGLLSGKSAEDAMRDPLYVPKTDAGEWVLQKLGEALPAMPGMHIPSKSKTAKALADRKRAEEALKKKVDAATTPPKTEPTVPKGQLDFLADPDVDGRGPNPYIPLNEPLRVDENGMPIRQALSEDAQPRIGDLFGDSPAIPEPTKPAPVVPPTMRVTPEGQAFAAAPDTTFWQDRAAAATRAEQDQLAFFRQQAMIRAREARAAEEARGQVPLRGQTGDAFNPYPVVGDAATMEAMSRANSDMPYGQVPPDGVIPRDAMFAGGERDKPMLRVPRGNEWVKDENGMPVRQGLPESTVAPDYINDFMRQDKPARDALGNAIQEANGPLLGPDQPFGSERLGGSMGAPALSKFGDTGRALADAESAKRSGVGVGGPHGAQRGAIDVKSVKEELDKLKKGLIKGPEALRAFTHTFDTTMNHDDTNKPGGGHIGWGPAIDNSRSAKSNGRLVWMSPDDFHDAALPRHVNSFRKTGIGEDKRTSIREGIHAPEGLSSVPVLRIENGKVVGHEGRHRMDVMRELGVSKAPVYVHTVGHTNADGPLLYRHLLSEDGSRKVAVPESIFPMGKDPLGFAPKTPVGQSGIGRAGGLTRGGADFGVVDTLKKNFKEVDDIVKAVQTALPPKAKDIVSSALKEGRDGRGIDLMEAGGVMTGAKRNSALIRDVVRVKQHFMAAAERTIRDVVFPYEKAIRDLSKTELTELSSVLKKEMFSGSELSIKAMGDAGFSEKQILAYQKLRRMTDTAWEQQNAVRVAAGEKPLTKLEAYINSQRQGAWRRSLVDANGRPKWFLASDSALRLEHDTKALLKQFPDLKAGDKFLAQKSKGGGDLHQIYSTMLKIMGDDPGFQTVKNWYEAQLADTASGALGQERFFERKYNVRGFVGDRPLTGMRSEFSEGLGLLQTQANYAKSAFKWSALQEASDHLKDVFADKDLQAQQPNNMAYAKKYFMHQFGANEATWVKALEDAIDKSIPFGATTTNQISRGIGNVKAVWTAQKLAFNAGYALANVFQLPQAIPYMTDIQVKHGGNPITGLAIGSTFGPILAAQHQLNPAGIGLHKMLALIPDKGMREFLAQAMKYAEDNQIVLSSAADEAPISKSFGPLAAVKRVTDKSISIPDSLRSIAYMAFATQLFTSGKMDNLSALRLAHEYTVRSMVDFREGERAMVFDKMGMAGNVANTLQSYSVNYFQQWNWAMREALRKNPLPFVAMVGVQGAVGGAMGLPFFSSIDKGVEWLKDQLKEMDPVLWKKIRDFSLSDLVLKTGGEMGLYGAASKNPLDVSVSSRVQAPAVEEMLAVPTAPVTDLAATAGSVAKAVADPMNAQKRAQAMYNVAPSGVQGYLETGPLADDISTVVNGGRIVRRPKDMADPTGMFFRSDADADVRKWGLRSQTEMFKRDQAYKASKREQDSREVLAKLPKRIYNAAKTNNSDLADYITMYVEMTPGIKTNKDAQKALTSMFESQVLRENTTSTDRLIAGKTTFEGVMAYKRFQDALKRAGYSE